MAPLRSPSRLACEVTPRLTRAMADLRSEFGLCRLAHDPEKWIPVFGKDHAPTSPLSVRQPVLLHTLAIGLEHPGGPAQLADLLLGPLDHAVTFAALGIQHLPGAGYLEALFRARFGLQLGHLALLLSRKRAEGPVHRRKLENPSMCMRHFSPPRQPFSRAARPGLWQSKS